MTGLRLWKGTTTSSTASMMLTRYFCWRLQPEGILHCAILLTGDLWIFKSQLMIQRIYTGVSEDECSMGPLKASKTWLNCMWMSLGTARCWGWTSTNFRADPKWAKKCLWCSCLSAIVVEFSISNCRNASRIHTWLHACVIIGLLQALQWLFWLTDQWFYLLGEKV